MIEIEASLAADRQRSDEKQTRLRNASRVVSHKDNLKRMWTRHIENKKAPEAQFYMPGPGQYESKNFIQTEPSFAVHKF